MAANWRKDYGGHRQAGFSLLELIVSLAIISMVSAALFQSIGSWMRLASRASTAADQSLSNIASQKMFARAVRGFVFTWPDETEQEFSGSPTAFSGLSQSPLDSFEPELISVQFLIERAGVGSRLVYQNASTKWALATDNDGHAVFSYLGADRVWRDAWPPAENPEPGPFNDAEFYDTPQFPFAIRVTFANGETWIADISSNPNRPMRIQDLQP